MIDRLVVICLLSGLAGLAAAFTGAGAPKPVRRIGVPFISMIFSLIVLKRWQMIFLMARAGVLSLGYGIPDANDPSPSMLGSFWYKILKKDEKKAAIATRGTLGLMECIVLSLICWTTGNWLWFFPACAGLLGSWIYFGAIKENEGKFKLFGYELLWEEVEIHGINTFIYMMMAVLCR